MKFLVILATLVITYFWQKDLDRIDDRWFFALRSRIERLVNSVISKENARGFPIFLLTFLLPLLVLSLILWLSDEWLFGLVALLIHLFILLMAFDRIHPGLLLEQYLSLWEAGDHEACYEFLENEMECSAMPAPESISTLHRTFCRLYVYRCFEKMFVMLFWYLLAGPLGVLFAYICYQLRDGVLWGQATPEVESIHSLILVLEWLPLRLLGVTLCLVGNFEACFTRLLQSGLVSEESTDQTVYEYALCALNGPDSALDNDEDDTVSTAGDGEAAYRSRVADRIGSLKNLMDRSQYAWLSTIALMTVLGWQL